MAISKVKLPDNSEQDVHDSRIAGIDTSPTASSGNVVTSGGVHAAFSDVTFLGDDDGTATVADFSPATDTVWNKAQTLSSAQQLQARTNIGVPTFVHLTDESDMPASPDSNTVYFIDEAQSS